MIKYLQDLVFVGAILQLIAVIPYSIDILKGTTKPNRISWLLWSVTPIIGAIAAISKGVGWSVLPVFMAGFAPFIVFLLSFVNKKSYWRLGKFDYICALCSILALVLWGLTEDPNYAIAFAIIGDAFAAIPTLVKSVRYPETETASAYLISLLAVLTSFAAITSRSFESLAYPIYLTFINSALFFSIIGGNHIKRKSQQL